MSISDADYKAWLDSANPQIRNVIIELVGNVDGSENTFYMTQKPFSSYYTCLSQGFAYTESLTIGGNFNLSIGTIDVITSNQGEYDFITRGVWENRQIKVKLGDVRWAVSDYRTVLDGIVQKIDVKDSKSFSIVLLDKMQRLNNPITTTVLGGTTDNKNSIIPFSLGEVCNVTPLLVDPTTYTYQVHPLAIESIIEVRDNEVPVPLDSVDLAHGRFTLKYAPKGTITCSVQGHKYAGTYSNKIGTLIQSVATQAGSDGLNFDISEIDTANISAFNASYPAPVGYYGTSEDNILTCIQALASSVGAQVVINKSTGKLQIKTFDLSSPVKFISKSNMSTKGLIPKSAFEVKSSITLNYCRNYTVQNQDKNIQIPSAHKELFAKEYRQIVVSNPVIKDLYKLPDIPISSQSSKNEDVSLLLTESDATVEANRRLTFFSSKKQIFSFEGFSECLDLELGQTINLTYPRYGLDSGRDGVVVSLGFDWFKATVQVGVLI